MPTKTAFHAQQQSFFDQAADSLAENLGLTRDQGGDITVFEACFYSRPSSVIYPLPTLRKSSFEDTWEGFVGDGFMRASPRNTGKGPGLLDLPTELRLEIYQYMVEDPWLPALYQDHAFDTIDIASFLEWQKIPRHERVARKSYSWILTHRKIFHEALELVLVAHPVSIYSLKDISRSRGLLQRTKEIHLEIRDVPSRTAREMLYRVLRLPSVRRLEIETRNSSYHPRWLLSRHEEGGRHNPNGVSVYYNCARHDAEVMKRHEQSRWMDAIDLEIEEVQWQLQMLERLDEYSACSIFGEVNYGELQFRERSLRLDRLENRLGWS